MASKHEVRNQPVVRPTIVTVEPFAAITGGDLHIRGYNLAAGGRPVVKFGNEPAHLIVAGDSYIIARVPESAMIGELTVSSGNHHSDLFETHVGIQVADSLHPVANPAIDREGNLYSTFSGSRGQKSPVSIYKIDTDYNVKPFLTEMMNATAIVFDHAGEMYVTSRHDGTVYKVEANNTMATFAEGMGTATGMAFDAAKNLYVGDRSGTIFKINPAGEIFVFATLEPSVSAYHLAFGPDHGGAPCSPPWPRRRGRALGRAAPQSHRRGRHAARQSGARRRADQGRRSQDAQVRAFIENDALPACP